MFSPIHIAGVTDDEITYEFRTIYLWILYGILIVGGLGLLFRQPLVMIMAAGWMVFYFFTVSVQYRRLGVLTKKAAMEGTVKISGSKWSFKQPLRITLPRSIAQQGGPGL